jgi:hypothetical protein
VVSVAEVKVGVQNLIDSQMFGGNYQVVYQILDGTLKYFEPIYVDLESAEPVCTVFPNPITDNQIKWLYVRNLEPVTFEFLIPC